MSDSKSSGGLGIGSRLFIVFLILKLCGVVAWSWWWVTAPLWIPLVIIIAVLLFAATALTALKR